MKKPNTRTCKFSEYRNWVIINLLLNNGCRAATIRSIKIKDLDLENRVIYLRHTKNKRSQVIPLCESLCITLKEYLRIRGGNADDYLFPNEFGEQQTENGLRCTIAKYNKRRGIEKTSIHMFHHTFAKEDWRADPWRTPSEAEQKRRSAKAGHAEADWKRLIRRLTARYELQETADQSLEGSGSGRAGPGRASIPLKDLAFMRLGYK